MIDQDATWRNQKWYFDADYCERTTAPILAQLIEKNGFVFDDTYRYIFHGKLKQYIVRFPHYGGLRDDPRIDTEKLKQKENKKQSKFKMKINKETQAAELVMVKPRALLGVSQKEQKT